MCEYACGEGTFWHCMDVDACVFFCDSLFVFVSSSLFWSSMFCFLHSSEKKFLKP